MLPFKWAPALAIGFALCSVLTAAFLAAGTVSCGPMCGAGQTDCDTYCCDSGYSCCLSSGRCCPHDYPHHCAASKSCYKYYQQAVDDCGWSFDLCGVQAGRSVSARMAEDGLAPALGPFIDKAPDSARIF